MSGFEPRKLPKKQERYQLSHPSSKLIQELFKGEIWR
jgi:hypothetical protein